MKNLVGNSSQTSQFDELESLFYTLVKSKKKRVTSPESSSEPKQIESSDSEAIFSKIPQEAKSATGSQILRLLTVQELNSKGSKVFRLSESEQITSKMSYDSLQHQQFHIVNQELLSSIQEEYRKAEERKQEALERIESFPEDEAILFPEARSEMQNQGSIEEKLASLFGEEGHTNELDKDGFAVPLPQKKEEIKKGVFAEPTQAYEEFFPFAGEEIKQIEQNAEFEEKVKNLFESNEAKMEDEAYMARKRDLYKPKSTKMNRKFRREMEQVEKLIKGGT